MASQNDDAPELLARALMSAFSSLISELHKAGSVETAAVVESIQYTAVTHRAKGNEKMAVVLNAIAEHLLSSVPEPPKRP